MGYPHPLLHMGSLLYVATILGRAKGRLSICPFLSIHNQLLPNVSLGIFYFMDVECAGLSVFLPYS